MVTEDPKIAWLGNRFVWRLRHIVWIGEPFVDAGVEQLGEFVRIEAEQTKVVSAFTQLLQLDRQEIEAAKGWLAEVAGDADPRLELAREPMVWWSLTAAFLFMFTLVLFANLFADVVRDAFDPRLRGLNP